MLIQLHRILANRYTKDITAPQWYQFSGSVTAFICFHGPITSQTWLPNLPMTPRLPGCYRTPPTSLLHPPLGLWPDGIMRWSRSNLVDRNIHSMDIWCGYELSCGCNIDGATTTYGNNCIPTHFLHSDSWRMTYDLWGTISWSSKTRIFSVESRSSKHDIPHSGCLHNGSGSRMPWCSRTSPSTRGRAAVHRHLRSIHRAWETMWCVKLPREVRPDRGLHAILIETSNDGTPVDRSFPGPSHKLLDFLRRVACKLL